jgi:thioredoxin reductase (NADPH)
MGRPLFFLVDDDAARLEALAGELRRRFGADYQVLAERSPSAALATLARLGAGDEVAMLVAPTTTAEMDGTELLVRAHELHPPPSASCWSAGASGPRPTRWHGR